MSSRMNRRSLRLAVWAGFLAVILVLGAAGCGKQDGGSPDGNQPAAGATDADTTAGGVNVADAMPAEPVAEPAKDPNAVVVAINGEEITQGRVDEAVDVQMRMMGAQMGNLPPALLSQYEKQISQRVLDSLVGETLLDQQVKAANVQVTDAETMAAIEERAAKQTPPITVEALKTMLESQGRDFEEFKERYKTGLVRQKFMESQWAGKIDVNDADAQAYYAANPQEFEKPEQIHASHILILSLIHI